MSKVSKKHTKEQVVSNIFKLNNRNNRTTSGTFIVNFKHIFPAHRTRHFSKLLKTNLLSETTVSQVQPAFICLNLFEFSNIKLLNSNR